MFTLVFSHNVLTLARDLDPDDEVRALARSALDGRDLEPEVKAAGGVSVARGLAWIAVVPSEGKAGDELARAARLVRDDGLALPVVSDPDGVLLVPGLPPGPAQIQLATTGDPAPLPGRIDGDRGHVAVVRDHQQAGVADDRGPDDAGIANVASVVAAPDTTLEIVAVAVSERNDNMYDVFVV